MATPPLSPAVTDPPLHTRPPPISAPPPSATPSDPRPPRSRRRTILPAGAIFAIFEQQLLLNIIPLKTSEPTLSAIRSWEGISHESYRNRRKSPEGRQRRQARPGGPGRGRGGGLPDREVHPQRAELLRLPGVQLLQDRRRVQDRRRHLGASGGDKGGRRRRLRLADILLPIFRAVQADAGPVLLLHRLRFQLSPRAGKEGGDRHQPGASGHLRLREGRRRLRRDPEASGL